jgi:hypothetical protein
VSTPTSRHRRDDVETVEEEDERGVAVDVTAKATVDREVTTLDIRLPVAYPAPIHGTADRVRAHLLGRTTELTGLRTQRVDITIAPAPVEPPKRRVR